ncbi:class I SAM-dependent methyltransferase [Actinomadura litoris]|uniref:Methyltransferase domain-containing protein n=1 Tax=Actinomadura litoris TaxID=2678616 RepID=A0A7K1L115_9ACTN|nr:class I SAM-dependent methyltransferase [Actinomadura litoris]MUN38003.1 methyltransferase domain-containing protein [Actinomadura litoris]
MYNTDHEERFDNDAPVAGEQLALLAQILNRETFGVLGEVVVSHGYRSWDVGTGDGSVARWLAARGGVNGHVVASDLKPQHVPDHPRIEAIRHDLTADPWPEPKFDLIHARLLLMHLVDRDAIAVRLAEHLRPGGALVLTDWACACADGSLIRSPVDEYKERVFDEFHSAVHKLGEQTGMDLAWASRTRDVLSAAGYEDITVRDYQAPGRGGEPSAKLARMHISMMESFLLNQTGLTEADITMMLETLLDPEFEMVTNHAYTTIVRIPK